MKERPNCVICGKEGFVMVYNKCFCGECIAKVDREYKEEELKRIKDFLK